MKTRIVAGAVFGLVLLGSLWWNEWSWTIFLCFVAVVGLKELLAMVGLKMWSPLNVLGYGTAFALIVFQVDIPLLLAILFLGVVLITLSNHKNLPITHVALFILGIYYILIGFNNGLTWYNEYGKAFVLYLIVMIWASDSFAYFTGYFFGRTKMAPVLSPKKTYEGLAGGIIGTMLCAYFLNKWFGLDLSTVHALSLGVFVAVVSPLGDLFESSIKRFYQVKDSGNLIPGHGGVLDRFDSFLFVMLFYQIIHSVTL